MTTRWNGCLAGLSCEYEATGFAAVFFTVTSCTGIVCSSLLSIGWLLPRRRSCQTAGIRSTTCREAGIAVLLDVRFHDPGRSGGGSMAMNFRTLVWEQL